MSPLGHLDHGPPQDLARGDPVGEEALQERIQGSRDSVGHPVEERLRAYPLHRLDVSRPKHVGGGLEAAQDILGLPLHPGPHRPFLAGGVGSGAGHVAERDPRAPEGECLGGRQGEAVGDPVVVLLAHAHRGHPEAEEARVVAGELRLDGAVGEEVVVDDLPKLGAVHIARTAPHLQDRLHSRVPDALEEHAGPDHPGGSEDDDVHVSRRLMSPPA